MKPDSKIFVILDHPINSGLNIQYILKDQSTDASFYCVQTRPADIEFLPFEGTPGYF